MGLSAAVKAGNAGFRIESYGIFVSKILGTFHICSSNFGLNGPLRQYFSLYRPSPKEREKELIDERKNVQTTPTRTYCKHSRPLPYHNPNK